MEQNSIIYKEINSGLIKTKFRGNESIARTIHWDFTVFIYFLKFISYLSIIMYGMILIILFANILIYSNINIIVNKWNRTNRWLAWIFILIVYFLEYNLLTVYLYLHYLLILYFLCFLTILEKSDFHFVKTMHNLKTSDNT